MSKSVCVDLLHKKQERVCKHPLQFVNNAMGVPLLSLQTFLFFHHCGCNNHLNETCTSMEMPSNSVSNDAGEGQFLFSTLSPAFCVAKLQTVTAQNGKIGLMLLLMQPVSSEKMIFDSELPCTLFQGACTMESDVWLCITQCSVHFLCCGTASAWPLCNRLLHQWSLNGTFDHDILPWS